MFSFNVLVSYTPNFIMYHYHKNKMTYDSSSVCSWYVITPAVGGVP